MISPIASYVPCSSTFHLSSPMIRWHIRQFSSPPTDVNASEKNDAPSSLSRSAVEVTSSIMLAVHDWDTLVLELETFRPNWKANETSAEMMELSETNPNPLVQTLWSKPFGSNPLDCPHINFGTNEVAAGILKGSDKGLHRLNHEEGDKRRARRPWVGGGGKFACCSPVIDVTLMAYVEGWSDMTWIGDVVMVVVDLSLERVKKLMKALCGCRDSEIKRQIWWTALQILLKWEICLLWLLVLLIIQM